jgi:hypothetical protein
LLLAHILHTFARIAYLHLNSQTANAAPPAFFRRRRVRPFPFSVSPMGMERREAPGACEAPFGKPCDRLAHVVRKRVRALRSARSPSGAPPRHFYTPSSNDSGRPGAGLRASRAGSRILSRHRKRLATTPSRRTGRDEYKCAEASGDKFGKIFFAGVAANQQRVDAHVYLGGGVLGSSMNTKIGCLLNTPKRTILGHRISVANDPKRNRGAADGYSGSPACRCD